MIDLVTDKLDSLDMLITDKKSGCTRVGNRYNKICAQLSSKSYVIPWVDFLNYFGVTLLSGVIVMFRNNL